MNYEVYAGETLLTSITTESISTGRGGMGGPNGGNGGGSGGQFSGERQAFAGDRPEIFDDRPGRNANE
ncbi:MAG: hypothetical protein LBO09_09025 [Candidatus Peribacteria bacterium]|nr:hypothetical protein [Candidatus Peribacteria bacterium]